MLVLLPVLTWLLAGAAILAGARGERRPTLRWALLIGTVLTGFYVVLVAEGLPLFHWFARGPVIGAWLLAPAALLAYLWPRRKNVPWSAMLRPRIRDHQTAILTGAVLLMVTAIGLIALLTPTNTVDCLTYHLPRQFM